MGDFIKHLRTYFIELRNSEIWNRHLVILDELLNVTLPVVRNNIIDYLTNYIHDDLRAYNAYIAAAPDIVITVDAIGAAAGDCSMEHTDPS